MEGGRRMLASILAGLRWGVIVGVVDGIAVWSWYRPLDGVSGFVALLSWSALLLGALGVVLAPVAELGTLFLARDRSEREQAAQRDGLLLAALTGSVGLVAFLRAVEGFALRPRFVGPVIAIGIVAAAIGYTWQRARNRADARYARLHRCSAGLVLIVALVGAAIGVPRSEPGATQARPGSTDPELPDIVVILIDTLRADHLKAYGHIRDTMPRVEEFFIPGVRFEQAHTPVPYTGPAAMSLMTGRHPLALGIRTNGHPLSGDVPVLAEALARNGYQTGAAIASAPLSAEWSGLHRGFDHYDDELYPLQRVHRLLLHTTVAVLVSRISGVSYSHRDAAAVNRAAFAWLERVEAPAPFFLWAHYFDPHGVYEPPREDAFAMGADPTGASTSRPIETLIGSRPETLDSRLSQQLESLYDGGIHYTDRHARALLDRVAALDRNRPTLYILTADHGETLAEVWQTGYAADHGLYVNQREIWIPLFVRGAGFEGPRTITTPVGLMDIVPTLQNYLGLTVAEDLAGVDLV